MNDYTILLLAQQREAELQRKQRDRQRLARACEAVPCPTQKSKRDGTVASFKRWLGTTSNLNTASSLMAEATD